MPPHVTRSQRILTISSQIVNEVSGSTDLPQDDSFPTERSHVTICRFSKNEAEEELWPDVRRHLRDMARLALSTQPAADRSGI